MTDKIRQVKQGRILNGERPAKTGAMAFFDFEELEVQVPASDVKPEAPVKPEVKALGLQKPKRFRRLRSSLPACNQKRRE